MLVAVTSRPGNVVKATLRFAIGSMFSGTPAFACMVRKSKVSPGLGHRKLNSQLVPESLVLKYKAFWIMRSAIDSKTWNQML